MLAYFFSCASFSTVPCPINVLKLAQLPHYYLGLLKKKKKLCILYISRTEMLLNSASLQPLLFQYESSERISKNILELYPSETD